MKRILAIAALFASMAVAGAQQFGVIGGMTSSKVDLSEGIDSKDITLYHAGVVYKADLGAGFALQPMLTYQVKGAETPDFKSKTGFAELSMGIQWGLDLLAFRPFVFAEPFVGYQLTGEEHVLNKEDLDKALGEAKNELEYGFGLGAGLEITSHIQLSCQLFRNLGHLYDQGQFDSGKLEGVKNDFQNIKSYQGIKFSLAILF